jgi:hypothetical protein
MEFEVAHWNCEAECRGNPADRGGGYSPTTAGMGITDFIMSALPPLGHAAVL